MVLGYLKAIWNTISSGTFFHWISPGISDGVGAGWALQEPCLWFGNVGFQSQGHDGALILVQPVSIGGKFEPGPVVGQENSGLPPWRPAFSWKPSDADRFADNFKSETCPATFFSERRGLQRLSWFRCGGFFSIDRIYRNYRPPRKELDYWLLGKYVIYIINSCIHDLSKEQQNTCSLQMQHTA